MDTTEFSLEIDKFDKRLEKALFDNGHTQSDSGPFVVDGILSIGYTCPECERDVRTLFDFRIDKVTQEGDADTIQCQTLSKEEMVKRGKRNTSCKDCGHPSCEGLSSEDPAVSCVDWRRK